LVAVTGGNRLALAQVRRAARIRSRDVRLWAQADGMASLQADLAAGDAVAVFRRAVVAFPDGPMAADNLMALCRRHHRLKTFGGWSVTLGDDATCAWVSPADRRDLTSVGVLPGEPVGLPERLPEPRQVRSHDPPSTLEE